MVKAGWFLCPAVCTCLPAHYRDQEETIRKHLPEFAKLKPKDAHWGLSWWKPHDRKSRLEFLDNLEKLINEKSKTSRN